MAVFFPQIGIAEISLTVLSVFMAYLAICSVTRHRRIVWLFSTVVSLVCYSLVFYILGVTLSADPFSRGDASASLACSALLLVGLAKSIVSHSVPGEHTSLGASSSCEQLLQMVFVLVLGLPPWSFGHGAILRPLVGAVFLLWVGQLGSRLWSASAHSRIKDDLVISEYMSRKHNAGNQVMDPIDFEAGNQAMDPTTDFEGVNFIVSGEVSSRDSLRFFLKHVINYLAMGLPRKMLLRTRACIPVAVLNPATLRYDSLVTIQDIWKHINKITESGSRDICLSFALFKLLRRRFRGCFLHESGDDNTKQFVVRGLQLSPQSQINPLRAFHIIEAELGFVFDFFYTIPKPFYLCTFVYTALTTYASSLTFHLASSSYVHGLLLPVVFSFLILGLLLLVSFSLANSTKVNRVVSACLRRKRSSSTQNTNQGSSTSLQMILQRSGNISILSRVCRTGSTWSNRAGQYCLFHGDYRGFTTRQIPNEAKEALINALKYSHGRLSDGRSSLSKNGEKALHWACDLEFVAEKILVWHVATTICHAGQHAKETRDNRVATTLSDYCAYLVGFAPELVADDIYATRLVFDNGRAAAMERLEGEGSLARMHQLAEEMDLRDMDFSTTALHDVVFKGKMLVAQLIKLQDDKRWKVLAEFWAELMLFVSPSHDSAAHLQRLKDGGELITHIWALLTHAGILERPSGRDDYTTANQTSVEISNMPGDEEATRSEIVEMV